MKSLAFAAIERDGSIANHSLETSGEAAEVCRSTAKLYDAVGYAPPWVGYLAVADACVVGTCAFKSAPVSGRVEIAYFTFPGYEGRGIATAMVNHLVGIARFQDPSLSIVAQTLPEPNASNAILQKLGFEFAGPVEHVTDGTVWEWRLPQSAGA